MMVVIVFCKPAALAFDSVCPEMSEQVFYAEQVMYVAQTRAEFLLHCILAPFCHSSIEVAALQLFWCSLTFILCSPCSDYQQHYQLLCW